MKRLKKIVFVLFMIVCIVAMYGCSKKNVGDPADNPQVEEEPVVEEEQYTFGFSGITMENPYFITLEASIREELEEDGHTLLTADPKQDVERQIAQIEHMIEEGIDGIFLVPVDRDKITPVLEKLKDADVVIMNLDTQVKEFEKYVDAYVGTDNKASGVLCGKDLAERLPKGGKVLILECPTMNSINERITGFEEAIAGKGFEVVGRENTGGDLNAAIKATEQLLKEHKDVSAIMCGNDPTALGALVAVHSLNRQDILIYGVDGSPDIKKEIAKENSMIAATAGQSPIKMGKEAVDVMSQILNKEKFARLTYEEAFLINKDNLSMYGIDGWQ